MSADRFFLDTNVLVYANDRSDAAKHRLAIGLVSEGLRSRRGVISAQVLSEFWVTVTRKVQTPLSAEIAIAELYRLRTMKVVPLDYDTVTLAVSLHRAHGVSYWDGLILAAAQASRCGVVYSEDLGHGRHYGDLVVTNPFVVSHDAPPEGVGP